MKIYEVYAIKNACFAAGKTVVPKGITVHSTGVNNPNLCRYVQPIGYTGEEMSRLGVNKYKNDFCNNEKPDNREICCHAFIGKLADGSVAAYQILPWDMRGWHGGGRVNDTHIGFEICEDGLTDSVYFNAAYSKAVELCAYLCDKYNLNPLADGVIIGHYEGYKRGIASNHGDPLHWFSKFGKSMDTLRADVDRLLKTGAVTAPSEFKEYTVSLCEGTPIYKDDLKTVTKEVEKTAKYTIVGEKNGFGKLKSGAGWVNLSGKSETVTALKVGDKCTVNQDAKTYWGQNLASFVYKTVYDVIEVSGDRVVFGIGKTVTAACNIKDLKKK